MSAPNLETERLILRQWRDEDLPKFAKMNADVRVMEFFPSALSKEKSDDLAQVLRQELQEKPYGLWAVEVKGGASFIGFVGLHYAEFMSEVEIGWRLDTKYWRRGYAFEAATEALDYAFNTLKLTQVVSFTTVENWRSRNLMEKLGMTRGEDFEHPKLPKGHPIRPHVLYRMSIV